MSTIRRPFRTASLLGLAIALAAPLAIAVTPQAATPQATSPVPSLAPDAALAAALEGSWRSPANTARDAYRHPGQTLAFFGLEPEMTVVEITPGGGWYAEILAPYLAAQGRYVAAVVDPATFEAGRQRDYYQRSRDGLATKFEAAPAQYGKASTVAFNPKAPAFGPAASADMVLTFRNVHNWREDGLAEGMFKGFFDVLKPGGILGVVEHRAAAEVPADDKSGYVAPDQVIALAKAAGFQLVASSEVNANPRDTRDHPNGVWSLPPSNNHPEAERARYQAIGESDRMTLRFRKPDAAR